MMARAKRIYILIVKVNKLFSLFSSRCFLKEIENMFSVFLSSYRNTRESTCFLFLNYKFFIYCEVVSILKVRIIYISDHSKTNFFINLYIFYLLFHFLKLKFSKNICSLFVITYFFLFYTPCILLFYRFIIIINFNVRKLFNCFNFLTNSA